MPQILDGMLVTKANKSNSNLFKNCVWLSKLNGKIH